MGPRLRGTGPLRSSLLRLHRPFLQRGPGRRADVQVEAGEPRKVYPGRCQGWRASISRGGFKKQVTRRFSRNPNALNNSNSASNYDRFRSQSEWV